MVEGALGPIAGLAGLDQLHQMVADFLVVFLVDASHLVAAASIPGRKLVDLEMSPLVTAGLEIDDLLRHPHALFWRAHGDQVPAPPTRGWLSLRTISELQSSYATRDCLDSPWFVPIVKQLD